MGTPRRSECPWNVTDILEKACIAEVKLLLPPRVAFVARIAFVELMNAVKADVLSNVEDRRFDC